MKKDFEHCWCSFQWFRKEINRWKEVEWSYDKFYVFTSDRVFIDDSSGWDHIENWFYYCLGLQLSVQSRLLCFREEWESFLRLKRILASDVANDVAF